MVRVRASLRTLLLAAIAFLVAAGFFAPAGYANAEPVSAGVSYASAETIWPGSNQGIDWRDQSKLLCDPNGERVSNQSRNCLPVYRWSGAVTELYRNLPEGTGDIFDSAINSSQIGILGLFFSFGSSMWETTVGLSEWATELNLINTVGGVIDTGAAALGRGILLGPLAVVLLVGVIIGGAWTAFRRGAFPVKNVLKAVAIIAVGTAMINGAEHTTQSEVGKETNFGLFSPGWIASTLNNTISLAGNGITSGLISYDESDVGTVGITRGKTETTCSMYLKEMKDLYKNSRAGITDNALPIALNNIWEDTGLTSWASAQFGPAKSGSTPMAAYSYCMLAEWQANIPPHTIYSILKRANDGNEIYGAKSLAVSPWNTVEMAEAPPSDPEEEGGETPAINGDLSGDELRIKRATGQSLIAWAACGRDADQWKPRGGWSVSVGKGVGAFQDEIQFNKDCDLWAKNEEGKQVAHYFNDGGFQIGNTSDSIQKAVGGTDSRAAYQYVSSLFGYDKFNTGGMNGIMYVISALVNMIVFGGLSLIVALAKAATAVLLIALFPMMLISMLPMFGNALPKFLKSFLGFSVLAWGYSLIAAIVVLIATIINRAGETLVGNYGSTFAMLISALSPAAALIMIAMLAKKVVGVNPLSPKSILGMAGMGGAIGATGANMLSEGMNRAKSRGKNAAKNAVTGANDSRNRVDNAGIGNGRGRKGGGTGGMSDQLRAGGGNGRPLTDGQEERRKTSENAATWNEQTIADKRASEQELKRLKNAESDQIRRQQKEDRKALLGKMSDDNAAEIAQRAGVTPGDLGVADRLSADVSARTGLAAAAAGRSLDRARHLRGRISGAAYRGFNSALHPIESADRGMDRLSARKGLIAASTKKAGGTVVRGAVRSLTGSSTEAWKNATNLQRIGMGTKTAVRGAGLAAAGLGVAMTGGALAAPIAGVAAARTGFAARNAVKDPNSEYNRKHFRKLQERDAKKQLDLEAARRKQAGITDPGAGQERDHTRDEAARGQQDSSDELPTGGGGGNTNPETNTHLPGPDGKPKLDTSPEPNRAGEFLRESALTPTKKDSQGAEGGTGDYVPIEPLGPENAALAPKPSVSTAGTSAIQETLERYWPKDKRGNDSPNPVAEIDRPKPATGTSENDSPPRYVVNVPESTKDEG